MTQSMTGYGKATKNIRDLKISIQIKSLNSKGLDVNVKLPSRYREKEMDVRSLISSGLQRGKIDLIVQYENQQENSGLIINKKRFKSYFETLKNLKAEVGDNNPSDIMRLIFQFPDVMESEAKELDEEEWNNILSLIKKALEDLKQFRLKEGVVLEEEFKLRVNNILNLLSEAEKYEGYRILTVKERIKKNLEELLSSDNYDKNRLEQELIFYMEKFDVTEEKVRLKTHCNYFIETIKEGGIQGKKLGFISQEMGREINTLGSKANDVDIQKIVVLMKDELEKIKEQTLNTL